MLHIDRLERGIVIDHIRAGSSVEIFNHLNLNRTDCSVAIIKNVKSGKGGRKDIIKIEDMIDVNLDILGFIDPGVTINIIEGGEIISKKQLAPPPIVHDVIFCNNPRCITSIEQNIKQTFVLQNDTVNLYRCVYCDQEYGGEMHGTFLDKK